MRSATGAPALVLAALLCLASCGGGGGGSTGGSTGASSGGSGGGGTSGGNTPPSPGAGSHDALTWHYDAMRSGLNANETVLTPALVSSATFGKVGEYPVDAMVDAQPLYVSNLAIPGLGNRNMLYVATQNDTVYAFDADSILGTSATVVWQVSLLPAGEAAVLPNYLPCGDNVLNGIMGTPVIDRTRNALYVVAFSRDLTGNLRYRLHALDLTSGGELAGSPTVITARSPGTGGNVQNGDVVFDPAVHQQRAALLEGNGRIYLAWGARSGDCGNYSSWVMSYDAGTLAQVSVINLVPNDQGAGIWMSGSGPAMDSAGEIYLVTGNGYAVAPGGATPATGSYANSVVRLAGGTTLQVHDYFAPLDIDTLNLNDVDLGGGGILLLPDQAETGGLVRHLAVLAGKDNKIYLVDRDHLGGFSTTANNIVQEIDGQTGTQEFLSAPVQFNGSVYFTAVNDPLKAFTFASARLSGMPASQSAHAFANGMPVVSANGTSGGIVWVDEGGPGVLYAYDASDASHLLYSSDQAAGARDQFGRSDRPKTPLVVNGHVYLGTSYSIAAFGLLH